METTFPFVFLKIVYPLNTSVFPIFFSFFLITIREETCRVKSGNFGHQVNSDSDLVCFIFKLLE